MHGSRFGAALFLSAAAMLIAAGCGTDSPTATSPTTESSALPSSTPASGPATGNAASPEQEGISECRSNKLRTDLGTANSAAGSVGFPIIFTNTGSEPCTLAGFPGVSYVTSPEGDPVGAPAGRQGNDGAVVTLAPGNQASALVLATNVENYGPDLCNPVQITGLRVYPPNSSASQYLDRAGTACRNTSVHQLRVRAIVAGNLGR